MNSPKKAPPKEVKKPVAPAAPKKTIQPISLVRGMRDILPADQPIWQKMRQEAKELMESYSFDRIDTPLLEETNLFVRGVGRQTDIVEKELFSFETMGGDQVSLRPEGTASAVRAYIQHGMFNLPQPVKMYCIGPMFRHDRPQHGRYRQFQQLSCEVFGDANPAADAQLILLSSLFLKDLGLTGTVRLNSIGSVESRAAYKTALVTYFRAHRAKLSEEDKKRLMKNPMRLLDSKEPGMDALRVEAPQMLDFLDEESKSHFTRVIEYVEELAIPYHIDPYLVRGLDYYNRTVFEWYADSVDPDMAQLAVGGGGRYDGLMELLGGRPTPAVGFALGLDRIFHLVKEKQGDPVAPSAEVFVAQLGDQGRKKALVLFEELRRAGVKAAEAFSKDSIKAQMEIANRKGTKIAIILGQKEVLDGTAVIRDMESGTQETVNAKKVVDEIRKKLGRV